MAMKGSGTAEEYRVVTEHDDGFGWIAYPDETMQRASHALVVDGEVWVLDPVDVPGLDERLAEYGDVAGVVVTLDRHSRDAAEVATRHEVPVFLPNWMDGVTKKIDAPVERFGAELDDTGYRAIRLHDNRFWQEVALWNSETGVLWVPESVGTAEYFLASGETLGVHPMLRALPPRRALGGLEPEVLAVGHGPGIDQGAAQVLRDALSTSRSKLFNLYVKNARSFLSF
ncbi:hypothetical protein [Haloarchaeobius sp. HRN-SO-5]|uniref:hypothetical protein n=1 Tax=Haloarchaeobius sp. HRN-SO-5 TaxID=3446118 RepID=UPI003EBA755B